MLASRVLNNYTGILHYDSAFADYNQALKLDPNDAGAYNNRIVAYSDLKDYDSAIADYNQALKLDPNDADAYNSRGLAYKNKGSLDKASEDFLKVLELNDNVELSQEARQHLQEERHVLASSDISPTLFSIV